MGNVRENRNVRARAEEISDDVLIAALNDPARRERLIFADEALVNEVIGRYLDELAGRASVPVVRGFAALSPLPRPTNLREAKRIVDGDF